MRMFVAVVPPAEVLEALQTFLEVRREADAALRWTDASQWHITLAFLADVPERKVEDLVERLGRAAARRAAMTLRLAGAGAFPSAAHARVLWLGATPDPPGTLPRLADAARAAANRAGVPVEGGRFRAHLTIARLREPSDVTKWLRILDTFEAGPWPVTEIELIESHLGQGANNRPRYETVGTFPIGPPDPN